CVAAAVQATVPGTVIQNRANATGQVSAGTVARDSNVVSVTVGAASAKNVSAVLAASTTVESDAGASVLIAHTLTNTGAAGDAFTLAITDRGIGGWTFGSVALFADANGDGQPDSATPIVAPVMLAPGEVFRFVARLS